MSLILKVDGDRWRTHLRRVADERPGMVPVAKGNGYGLGNHRLARRAAWLGVDTMAVGTYEEVADVADRFAGDIVVLTPWRPFLDTGAADLHAHRVIHTVGRLEDLRALADRRDRPRVVLERLTSMLRHGMGGDELAAAAAFTGVRHEGVALHLPLPGPGSVLEAERLLAGTAPGTVVWLSHLTAAEVTGLAAAHPELRLRSRIGTELWLGDRGALEVHADVLDAHAVGRGDRFGYRRRRAPRAGTVLVVSGGTAHGIGLEAPNGRTGARARTTALARGGLDAAGLARSPFVVGDRQPFFAEPPHMQVSMLFLPAGPGVPAVGDRVGARVRHTTTSFDRVEID